MDAIHGAAEIHGAGAERVAGTAGHLARQIRLARDHFRRRSQSGHSAFLVIDCTPDQVKPSRPTPMP